MAASIAFHKMVTSYGLLRLKLVTSRSLSWHCIFNFFHPSATNTLPGRDNSELISGKVV